MDRGQFRGFEVEIEKPGIKLGLRLLGSDVGEPGRPYLPIEQDTSRFEELLRNSKGMQ